MMLSQRQERPRKALVLVEVFRWKKDVYGVTSQGVWFRQKRHMVPCDTDDNQRAVLKKIHDESGRLEVMQDCWAFVGVPGGPVAKRLTLVRENGTEDPLYQA